MIRVDLREIMTLLLKTILYHYALWNLTTFSGYLWGKLGPKTEKNINNCLKCLSISIYWQQTPKIRPKTCLSIEFNVWKKSHNFLSSNSKKNQKVNFQVLKLLKRTKNASKTKIFAFLWYLRVQTIHYWAELMTKILALIL